MPVHLLEMIYITTGENMISIIDFTDLENPKYLFGSFFEELSLKTNRYGAISKDKNYYNTTF